MKEELKAKNPWLNITEENIAQCDKEFFDKEGSVKEYAKKINEKFPDVELAFDCLPDPFSGNPDGKVYCLNMNPGKPDSCFDGDENFVNATKKNLALNSESCFWANTLVNKCGETHAGVDWLLKRTGQIGEIAKNYKDFEGVSSDEIFFIEYFPYHSTKGFNFPKDLPSYKFSNDLIVEAIKNKKIIIIMRSVSKWLERIPELETYDKLYVLKSSRCGYLTPKNILSYKDKRNKK